MSVFKMISGYFIGEDSRKRQMGLVVAFVLSFLYWQGIITLDLYEATMPFVILWTGAAFSARLSKLQKAIVSSKN